jgi:hypothetical protein
VIAYTDRLETGVVIFDGGTGTSYQAAGLSADDFGGADLEGCNELLNVTRPDVVADLHRAYYDVGVDVVETNTFGAFAVPLTEYDISDRAYDEYMAGDGRPRFVAGQRHGRGAARGGSARDLGRGGNGVPIPPGADDFGARLPPPPGEVFHRPQASGGASC